MKVPHPRWALAGPQRKEREARGQSHRPTPNLRPRSTSEKSAKRRKNRRSRGRGRGGIQPKKEPMTSLDRGLSLISIRFHQGKGDTCPAGNRVGAVHIMAMCPHPKHARHLIGRWHLALICPDIRQRGQQIEEAGAAGRLKLSERLPKTRLGDRSTAGLVPPSVTEPGKKRRLHKAFEIFGLPTGSRLAPDRGGDLTASAKVFLGAALWTKDHDFSSSAMNAQSSLLQFGPPLPQRWKKRTYCLHEKLRRL